MASNRRQPARSARTTAARPSNYYAKPVAYRNVPQTVAENEQPANNPPGFCPALTHFTDSISALPQEVQRNLTLLGETEGKAHQRDQDIGELIRAIKSLPDPPPQSSPHRTQAFMQFSVNNSVSGSATGSVAEGSLNRQSVPASSNEPGRLGPSVRDTEAASSSAQPAQQSIDDQMQHRQRLFMQLQNQVRDMTIVLDEKQMVLSSASDALSKQLTRLQSSMPYIENEISEDARLGSNTHWALHHMRELRRMDGTTGDKSKRDVQSANNLAAAAAAIHEGEIAATRSEARREAVAAKKNRVQPAEEPERPTTKKATASGKTKKATEAAQDTKAGTNGTGQAQKKRKIEKGTAVPMERSISAALNGRLGNVGRASPRASPVPEAKGRKKPPAQPGTTSRKKNAAKSPSVASSPTAGTFPTKTFSPAPPQRGTARGPRNSQQSTVAEVNRRRPASRTRAGPTGNMASDSRNPTSSRAVESRRSPTEPMEGVVVSEKQPVAPAATDNDAAMADVQPISSRDLKREETEPIEEQAERTEDIDGTFEHSTNIIPADTGNKTSALVTQTRSRRGSRSSKPDTPLDNVFAQENGRNGRNLQGGNGSNGNGPASGFAGSIPAGDNNSPTKGVFGTGPEDRPQSASPRRKSTNGTSERKSDSRTPDTARQLKPVPGSRSPTTNQDGHQPSAATGGQTPPRSIDETAVAMTMGNNTVPAMTATATARRGSTSVKQAESTASRPVASPILPATFRPRKPSQPRNPAPPSSSPPPSSDIETKGNAGPAETEVEEADEDSEASENEPKYCHCGQVSYGQMIGCDNERCPREWFHLACVKMEKVPNSKTKWFCSRACREEARGLKVEEARAGPGGGSVMKGDSVGAGVEG
ncbi:MAG: hypothetical protein M1831_005408 [Alyxoria varia]|nr:MAG: hypothetical protein M1831_005408 [Alyxoria varia]